MSNRKAGACAHERLKFYTFCYGADDLWRAQAKCLACNRLSKDVSGFASRNAAKEAAEKALRGAP